MPGSWPAQYNTDHSRYVVTPDALDIIEKMVWHFDEPFADSSAIPTWYVSKMARQKVTVALSGDGGDETFAGYIQRYSMNRLEENIRRRLPAFLRTGLLGPLASLYPRLDFMPRPLRLKTFPDQPFPVPGAGLLPGYVFLFQAGNAKTTLYTLILPP